MTTWWLVKCKWLNTPTLSPLLAPAPHVPTSTHPQPAASRPAPCRPAPCGIAPQDDPEGGAAPPGVAPWPRHLVLEPAGCCIPSGQSGKSSSHLQNVGSPTSSPETDPSPRGQRDRSQPGRPLRRPPPCSEQAGSTGQTVPFTVNTGCLGRTGPSSERFQTHLNKQSSLYTVAGRSPHTLGKLFGPG